MIKIIGCAIIIVASSMIGFIFAEDLKRRSLQLRDLQSAVLQLQNEILFTHTTLPDAFIKISRKCKDPISSLLTTIGNTLMNNEVDTVYEAFKVSIKEHNSNLKLDKYDADIVMELGKGLGESDIDGHKKIFLLVDDNLRKRIEDADCQINKSVKMYRYLGFSFGAVVAILLI